MTKIKFIGKCILIEQGKKYLIIGDLHLGFEEELNKIGVFITRKMMEDYLLELKELKSVVKKVDASILLGDLKHGFGSINNQEWNESRKVFTALREFSDKIVIVKGNHDVLAPQLLKNENVELHDYYILEDVFLAHGDKDFKEIWKKEIKHVVIGHAHPAIRISDGVKSEKYKCFLEGMYKKKKFTIVPSFVEYNTGTDPRDFDLELPWPLKLDSFNVIVVESNTTNLNFGKLGKIN